MLRSGCTAALSSEFIHQSASMRNPKCWVCVGKVTCPANLIHTFICSAKISTNWCIFKKQQRRSRSQNVQITYNKSPNLLYKQKAFDLLPFQQVKLVWVSGADRPQLGWAALWAFELGGDYCETGRRYLERLVFGWEGVKWMCVDAFKGTEHWNSRRQHHCWTGQRTETPFTSDNIKTISTTECIFQAVLNEKTVDRTKVVTI